MVEWCIMSKEEQGRLWRQKIRGWELAAQKDAEAEKKKTRSEVWREINVLFQTARDLPRHPSVDAEIEQVRQRWIRIKRGKTK